jgi:glycosyltransferase involved in cell wall biosynthesis
LGRCGMRVCHVWHNFLPLEMGGVERYILTLSDYLGGKYPELQFSLITDKTAYPFFRRVKIPKHEQISRIDVNRVGPNLLSAARDVYFKLFHQNSSLIEHQLTKKLFHETANIQNIAQSDVFHIHGLWALQYPALGLWLSRHFNKPLVVSLHGDTVGTEFFYSMPLQKKEFAAILHQASAITTYSETVLATLAQMGLSSKSWLIPNFVDTQHFKRPVSFGDAGAGTRVVMVCRLDPFKDPLTAVQAFEHVIKDKPEATLQIVGDGPLYEPLKSLIGELHLENSVFLMGKHADVRPFLWNSDVMLTGNAFLSVLEAWSAGTAVVAADKETTGKLISQGKNGVLVKPKAPKELASALLQVMNDSRYRGRLVRNGFETVNSYDVSCAGEKFLGIYCSCIEKPSLVCEAKGLNLS